MPPIAFVRRFVPTTAWRQFTSPRRRCPQGRASLNLACRDHVPTFPQRSPPSLLTTAACGGLRSTPDCRPRRALLHLSYSCIPPCGPAILVTQDPCRTSADNGQASYSPARAVPCLSGNRNGLDSLQRGSGAHARNGRDPAVDQEVCPDDVRRIVRRE